MPRKPTPDGRRFHENVMLSEPERDLLDSVRGEVKRGPWMREAALEAARRIRDSRIRERLGGASMTLTAAGPEMSSATLSGTGTVSALPHGEEKTEVRSFTLGPDVSDWLSPEDSAYDDEPELKPENCKHENLKLSKGVCPDCFTYVDHKPSPQGGTPR